MKKLFLILIIAAITLVSCTSGGDMVVADTICDFIRTDVRGINPEYKLEVVSMERKSPVTERSELERHSENFGIAAGEIPPSMEVYTATVAVSDPDGKRSMSETYDFYLSPDLSTCYGKMRSR